MHLNLGEAVNEETHEAEGKDEEDGEQPMDHESLKTEDDLFESDLFSVLRSGFRRTDELRQKQVSHLYIAFLFYWWLGYDSLQTQVPRL